MATITTIYDGGREADLTGEEVLEEVFDLIRRLLPRLHPDDPVRASFLRLAPMLGTSLGHSLVALVREPKGDE